MNGSTPVRRLGDGIVHRTMVLIPTRFEPLLWRGERGLEQA